VRRRDPHLERERQRYEHPLPSREYIQDILREAGPTRVEQLAPMLAIEAHEDEAFARRLKAMEREGQLHIDRKERLCVPDKLDLVRGKIQGHKDGFGFVIPDAGGEDLFLPPSEMRRVMHGDLVMAREAGRDRRGRREGRIVEVLERAVKRVVGRLRREYGVAFVSAEDRRISQDVLIPQGEDMGASAGQVVTVELIAQPDLYAKPVGRVVEVLGGYTDDGMEIEIALRKFDLPHAFPEAVEKLAAKLPKKVRKLDHAGREDLRALPLVTIDGETARDFDDAVYAEQDGKGWRLVVAIADVSHYVQPNDALDAEALNRGNSVYFPRRVIPMLPEALSNGLCSLNPDVERLAMVCDMSIGPKGAIRAYRFYPAVIFSHARLTYTQVWDWLSGQKPPEAKHAGLMPQLRALNELFHILLTARAQRGAIDFDTLETQLVFDQQGKIERIVPLKRNDAHRLIEECMLAANVCASEFLHARGQPALYRVHEGPTPEKLEALHEFLREFGLYLTGNEAPRAKDYAALMERIKGRPDQSLLQTVMLRSLRQAVYSPDNAGHFGLAYEAYTHFTSPIRRYPDLLIHRAIKAALAKSKYEPGKWEEIGAQCSMTERRADDATREVEAWLKAYFMRERVGEVFEGSISAVTGFGIFVALDDLFVEGLVHITELGQDYFHFDAGKHWLLGERTGQRFRLGDRVCVKVVRVDVESRRIDFALETRAKPVSNAAASVAAATPHAAPVEASPQVVAKPKAAPKKRAKATDGGKPAPEKNKASRPAAAAPEPKPAPASQAVGRRPAQKAVLLTTMPKASVKPQVAPAPVAKPKRKSKAES
jgi:ribonuclease R